MSIATLVLGESGTGKTSSLRNLNPNETFLIQPIKKHLPFKTNDWNYLDLAKKKIGNIFVTDSSEKILQVLKKTEKKIIVIDDFQYIMSNEYMKRYNEKGYERFSDIARHAWDVLSLSNELEDDVRVYILSHTQSDEFGNIKIKTIGKMLDEKITIEGMFTIVLRTMSGNGEYKLSTRNNGSDTVKTPFGMFGADLIDNDLKLIDEKICEYYNIGETK